MAYKDDFDHHQRKLQSGLTPTPNSLGSHNANELYGPDGLFGRLDKLNNPTYGQSRPTTYAPQQSDVAATPRPAAPLLNEKQRQIFIITASILLFLSFAYMAIKYWDVIVDMF